MKNNLFNQKNLANIYAKPSIKSEIVSQILFGEKFRVLNKKKNWLKIKTSYDKYTGFLRNIKTINKFIPTHKVYKSKTRIFRKVGNKFIGSKKFLYFASKISVSEKNYNFLKFNENEWIKKGDLKPINYYEKKFIKILRLFLNTKYLWGGKTSEGIDCSALVQIYFFFNNIYFPRDTKDQLKFLRKTKKNKLYQSNKLYFWKGHVAVCLDKNLLIHAYGPRKKVVIMKKNKTVMEIKKNTNLDLELI